jgi:IS5 family transposase
MNGLWRWMVGMGLAGSLCWQVGYAAEPMADADAFLTQTQALATVDHPRFLRQLALLNHDASTLTPSQQWRLRYSNAWEAMYQGDYAGSEALFRDIIQHSGDPLLADRSSSLLLSQLGLTRHYTDAFELANRLAIRLPLVTDRMVRISLLLNLTNTLMLAGQTDLAVYYARMAVAEAPPGASICWSSSSLVEALNDGHRLASSSPELQRALDACAASSESVYSTKEPLNKSHHRLQFSHPNDGHYLMSQLSFSDAEYAGKRKQTKREKFLAEMEQVVPWDALLALIEPVYPRAGNGRRPYLLATMLRVHLMQNWYGYSDPGMEEALYEVAPLRRFAGLSLSRGSVPDETTILNFRRLLEKHDLSAKVFATVNGYLGDKGMLLREGTIVDATIIHAPPSTKNKDHKRDPDMHQTRKGNQWYFGMKAHIGVDAESGLTHTLTTTAANVGDVVEIDKLLHGKEKAVYADAGYTGAEKRAPKRGRKWHIAAKRSKVKALPEGELKEATKELEHLKAAVRSKVEHVFRIIKRQFGYQKVRFKGLAKNMAQIQMLLALANLYHARKRLLAAGEVRL